MTYHTTEFINFIGAFSGAIAISIAIYFQFVSGRDCHPKYVLSFLIPGVLLVMINMEPFSSSTGGAVALETMAYVIITIVEIYAAMYVYSISENSNGDVGIEEMVSEGVEKMRQRRQ